MELHPGAKWLFRLRAYYVLLIIAIYPASMVLFFLGLNFPSVLITLFVYLLIVLGIGEIYAQLTYKNWSYELNEEGLKIERGIIWKKYSSIPYARIQNVDIRRGIIARLFDFSSMEIETAGGSQPMYYNRRGRRAYHSEGYIPAVGLSESDRIRVEVLKQIRLSAGEGI